MASNGKSAEHVSIETNALRRSFPQKNYGCGFLLVLRSYFQRDLAAFLAISLRRFAVRLLALALPPLAPPSLPSATAAGFLPASGSSSGVPFICSPMALSTTDLATCQKSFLGMTPPCHDSRIGARASGFKLSHYPQFGDRTLGSCAPLPVATKLRIKN